MMTNFLGVSWIEMQGEESELFGAIEVLGQKIVEARLTRETPSVDLLVATIELARHDIARGKGEAKASALAWVRDDDEHEHPAYFSFRWTCDQLGWDVEETRRSVLG